MVTPNPRKDDPLGVGGGANSSDASTPSVSNDSQLS